MKNKVEVKILYAIILICISSCSTPKFYSEITTMQEEIQSDINKQSDSSKKIKIKECDMNKLVLNKLKDELKSTNHIIYYYSPDTSLSSEKIWVTIYDSENKIYYSLESNSKNPKQIDLIEKGNQLNDKHTSFVFDNYFENNCDFLKKKGEVKLSGIRAYEAIYEVNLKDKENKNCYFKNFILLD